MSTQTRCPRCGRPILCQRDDISHCACASVNISARVLERIRERFDGCLCITCLTTLKAEQRRLEEERTAPADGARIPPPFHLRTPTRGG
ncbi:MAG: cysteine-rich CWC family protein [Gammaproteobacteria bacterium]